MPLQRIGKPTPVPGYNVPVITGNRSLLPPMVETKHPEDDFEDVYFNYCTQEWEVYDKAHDFEGCYSDDDSEDENSGYEASIERIECEEPEGKCTKHCHCCPCHACVIMSTRLKEQKDRRHPDLSKLTIMKR